ncbi:MAG: GIY-YIG nuclease family protein [Thermoplasmata archaeon]|nr:MAG: GIY-YIG nuclease family protein [Thermoplasmata archaeon]KAA0018098.1 MAG: GIY-YIG nuclease family protein [Thermoplasmata archaeon]
MKGSYILIVKIPENKRIRIGKLGYIQFEKGFYIYVGSAMNGLEGRIRRHLSGNKKLHWHLDYLLGKGKVMEVYIKESNSREECEVARKLSEIFDSISGFGSSDCRCRSHLFYAEDIEKIRREVATLGFQLYFSQQM